MAGTAKRAKPMPRGLGSIRQAREVLERADRLLVAAVSEPTPVDQFLAAYLAALRGAAAALIALGVSIDKVKPQSAWLQLTAAAPEFGVWVDYFSVHSKTRAALASGIDRPVPPALADEFHQRVAAFLHDVDDLVADPARGEGPGQSVVSLDLWRPGRSA